VRTKIVQCLATGFYIGRIPWMPGTFGTLLGIPLAYALAHLSPLSYMFACIVFLVFSSLVCELYERAFSSHDPSEIVIDEVAGFLVAMTWLPLTWQAFLGAFLAFRFFDILKPPPIRQIDQKVKGGLGTVLDDIAAGLAANVILQIVYTQTSWLGVKLGSAT
jgi:phosphatidylglycerophosphatase A